MLFKLLVIMAIFVLVVFSLAGSDSCDVNSVLGGFIFIVFVLYMIYAIFFYKEK